VNRRLLLVCWVMSLTLVMDACRAGSEAPKSLPGLPVTSQVAVSPVNQKALPQSSISSPLPSPTHSPTPRPTLTPFPSPTAFPRPSFDDYPQFIADFLNTSGDLATLEQILRDWQAITDNVGSIEVRNWDREQLVIVQVLRPVREEDGLPNRLMIFRLVDGSVTGVFDSESMDRHGHSIQEVPAPGDTNVNRQPDVTFVGRFCGAHTCYDSLHIVEWDGQAFVDLIEGNLSMPYPTYVIDWGQITAVTGHILSAGAGEPRAYTEIWQWNGSVFTVTEKVLGLPTVRMHLIHDADAALERGDSGGAIELYEQAIRDQALSSEMFYGDEDFGTTVIRAYARFKLVVAYAAAGQTDEALTNYEQLIDENPSDTVGYVYVALGQAFWNSYLNNGDVHAACAAAISVAEANPKAMEQLYIGYQNPWYEAADICRIN
jgi:hypothetical protein